MKIIIIGAGLTGLILGNACEKAGIDYHIYEKTAALKNIGGGVIIWPHGLRYLHWLQLDNILTPYDITVPGCHVLDRHGELLYQEPFTQLNQLLNGKMLPIDRSQLQRELVAGIPHNKISFSKRCIAIKHNQAQFDDDTFVKGDLIIGADGVHSAVRQAIFPEAQLQNIGVTWWGGILNRTDIPDAYLGVNYAVALNKICIIWPLSGERYMWFIPANAKADTPFSQLCAEWDNKNIKSILNAKVTDQFFQSPIYSLSPPDSVMKGTTILLGDAAHAMGPILGQGVSLAIEDVYLLMQCLQEPALLENYNQQRCHRYRRIHQLEAQAAKTMINDDEEKLTEFELQMKEVTLSSMYSELIPLVNEHACKKLSEELLITEAA